MNSFKEGTCQWIIAICILSTLIIFPPILIWQCFMDFKLTSRDFQFYIIYYDTFQEQRIPCLNKICWRNTCWGICHLALRVSKVYRACTTDNPVKGQLMAVTCCQRARKSYSPALVKVAGCLLAASLVIAVDTAVSVTFAEHAGQNEKCFILAGEWEIALEAL